MIFSLQQLDYALRRSPLCLPAIGAGFGIVAADTSPLVWLISGTLLLLGTAILFQRRNLASWTIWLLTALTLLAFTGRQAGVIKHIETFPLGESLQTGQSVEVTGKGWISSIDSGSTRSTNAVLHLDSLSVAGHQVTSDHRLPIWIQSVPKPLAYGSRIEFSGLLRPLEPANSPGGFDPAAFYYRQHNSPARLEIRSGDTCQILPGREGAHIVSTAKTVRSHLEAGLITGLPPEDEPYARLIAAMTLGARENSPEELEDWYRLSGTMHLFAVSGLHVGIIAGVFLFTTLLLRVPRRWAVLIIIPLILFYAVLTGLRPSAIRAAIMLSIVLASFAVKEQPRLLNSLSLAALLLLAFNPQQLFLPGFQLSFAVLFSIIVLGDLVRRLLAEPWLSDPFIPKSLLSPLRRLKDKLVGSVSAALSISLVAWLGSILPLAWHFHSLAPVGILANLIMIPVASVLVVVAVTTFAFSGLHLSWLSGWLTQMSIGLATLLTSLAQFFATLPGAHVHVGNPDQIEPATPITIDVMGRHGELATLITHHPSSSHWMLDSGSPLTYRQQMLPLLRHRGINHIDALILSHGDQGHIGAAPLVLSQLEPHLIFEARAENRAASYPAIVTLADSLGIMRNALAAGQVIHLDKETKWQVLSPPSNPTGRFADDRALVLKLTTGQWSILFTSDSGFETEKRLLDSGAHLRSDIWIRGQHRESPSGLSSFVKAVAPRAVISTHSSFPPAEQIPPGLREQLDELGIPLFQLDQTGVITLKMSSSLLEIAPYSRSETGLSLAPESP